jgi:non-homologous end joining protein Ku
MPRASWKGFLRLSLVSCPIYLSPASTRTKSIRLHRYGNQRLAVAPRSKTMKRMTGRPSRRLVL